MEGGNEVSVANGITQFAEGEPKRRNFDTVRVYQPLEGGNGVREANVVTLPQEPRQRFNISSRGF